MNLKSRKHCRRFISLLLVFCMTIVLAPIQAGAAVPEGKAAYIINHSTNVISYYDSFDEAWDSTFGMNDFTIGLLADLHLYRLWYMSLGNNYVLELNGHKLFKENNKEHDDGALINLKSGTLKIYGGRQNWTLDGNTVTMPQNPEDAIPGTYYDSTGLAQTSGTASSNSVWNMCYYDNGEKSVKFSNNDIRYNISGGLLSGGWTDNGGAIQMTGSGAGLDLYDVTLAGNIADDNGGAIAMMSNYQKLTMTDSRLAFNLAEDDDGGGLFIKGDYCKVYMTRSHVDYNIANDNGGGIALTGTKAVIVGDAERMDPSDPDYPGNWDQNNYLNQPYNDLDRTRNPFWDRSDTDGSRHVSTAGKTSTIAYNIVPTSDIEGGGSALYVDGKNTSVGGLNIMKNITGDDPSGDRGEGAVHLNTEGNTLANSNVWYNWSSSFGGGVYVDNDGCALTDVTVTENFNDVLGRSGGGVYVLGTVNLSLGGQCIIKDNNSLDVHGDQCRDNLYLSSSMGMKARIYSSLTKGSEIWLATDGITKITKVAGNYNDRMFWSDIGNRHVEYKDQILSIVEGNGNDEYRKEKYPDIPETALVPEEPITEGSRTKKLSTEYTSENGISYPLYQGVVEFPAFLDAGKDLSSTFFYSDGYFDRDPKHYDSHLATASMHLAMASFYSNDGNEDAFHDSEGSTGGKFYPVKSNNIRQFLSDLGVKEEDIFLNDYYIQKPGSDTIGVAIGNKDIILDGNNKKLVIVGVRGAGYEQEWVSNMTLGSSGEAKGFSSAANQVFSELTKYLQRKGIDGSSQDTIFWVAGYSRAGATSNLTGARIVDRYDNQGSHTFVYTFEAPQGGESTVRDNNQEKYTCIHNLINDTDLVPQVGPSLMGFHRYGVDHYVPGDPNANKPSYTQNTYKIISNSGTSTETRSFYTGADNSSYSVGSITYTAQRTKMLSQLKSVAGYDMIFSDYFHAATISYLGNTIFGNFGWQMIDEDGDLKTNIPSDKRNTADFVPYFLEDLQNKSLNYMVSEENKASLDGLYRMSYSQSTLKNVPFETAAANAAGVVFGMTGEEMEGFLEVAGTLMDRIDVTGLYSRYLLTTDDIKAYAVAVGGGAASGGAAGSVFPVVGTIAGAAVGGVGSAVGLGIYNLFVGGKTVAQITDEIWSALSAPTEEQLKNEEIKDKYMEERAKGYKYLQDVWSDDEKIETLKTSLPALTFVLLDYLKDDYDATGNDVLGTMVYNVNRILANHYPEVNLAWLRSYDSYYDSNNDNAEKVVLADNTRVTEVAEPLVNGISDHAPVVSQSDPVVTLTVPGDVNQGAGIFYRFSDIYYPDDNWHPYTGPITLPVKDGEARMIYNLYTYAIHDGIRSNTKNYTICLDANNQFQYTYPGILSMDITGRIPLEKDKEYSFEAPSFETQAFRNWTVVDGFDDPSGKLSGLDLNARTNTFLVNALGNYSIKANYFDKSNAVTLTMGAVTSGQELPQTAVLNTATPLNGNPVEKNVSVPVAWTDLGNDRYLATFNLPVDAANELCYIGQESGWIFKSYDTILEAAVNDANNNGEGIAVTKEGSARGQVNADGSAVVSQLFTITGYTSPAAMRTVTINAWDVNTNDMVNYAGSTSCTVTYQYVKNTSVSIPIPPVTSENCIGIKEATGVNAADVKIENGALSFIVPDENVELTLNFKPVVNMISLVVSGEPQAGKVMPSYLGTFATIENAWAITNGVTETWDPNMTEAAYNTAYTLHLTINTSELKGVMVNDDATEWSAISSGTTVPLAGSFDLSENLAIRAVDENGNALSASCAVVSKGENTLAVDVTFPSTMMNTVELVPELSPMIYSGSLDNVEYAAGPSTIPAIMTDGTMEEINVSWGPVYEENGITVMTGTISSDVYELNDNIGNVSQILVIESAPEAQTVAPTASLMLGGAKTYAGRYGEIVRLEDSFSAKVALFSSADATIYYTTDGTDPTTSSSRYTEPFEVGWDDSIDASYAQKDVMVKAIAVEAGKQESNIAAFVYTLEKDTTTSENGGGSNDGSSGGGNGGAAVATNAVLIAAINTHGSASSSMANARAGDRVTITVIPDEGYEVSVVNVTDGKGSEVDVNDNGDGTYTFKMPSSAVTVTPTFIEIQKPDDPGEPDEPTDQACPKDDTCPITPFKDTNKNEWYHDGVHWALEKNIMNGTSDNTFEPMTSTTRAMIVTMLWRMEGSPQAEGSVTFKDVTDGQWYTDAIRWAAANGIVTGYDSDTFGTNDSVTREQLATILYRSAQAKGKGFTGTWYFPLNFDDADQVSEWADEAMHWMTMNGVIQGMSDTILSPKSDAVRAQVATMLMRFSEKVS